MDSSNHLTVPRPRSHRRLTSKRSLARHLILQSQLTKAMSPYGMAKASKATPNTEARILWETAKLVPNMAARIL
jgi:hypothetical protein